MTEGRIQDWIRYVQENAENVAEPDASTRAPETRSDDAPPPIEREKATAETSQSIAALAAEKRVADSLRAHRIASLRAEKTEDAPPLQDETATKPRVKSVVAKTENAVTTPKRKPVSRQRIRPETRAQMLERLTNPMISLHEASVILGVCSATVRRFCDAGTLPHERTAGGQRRFRLAEVMKLYRARHGEKSPK